MPLIPYQCSNEDCNHYFEVKQGYHDKRKTKCPACKKKTLFQVFCAPVVSVPKTVGSLAEKNTKLMGKYAFEEQERKNAINDDAMKLENLKKLKGVSPDAKVLPDGKSWFNPSGKDVGKELKPILGDKKKIKKYIKEGKK